MRPLVTLLEDTLATWRVVRLVRSDVIAEPLRRAARDVLDEEAGSGDEPETARAKHPKLATLIECPYCLSIWAAAAVLVLRAARCGWLVRLLAMSAVAGEVAATLDESAPDSR